MLHPLHNQGENFWTAEKMSIYNTLEEARRRKTSVQETVGDGPKSSASIKRGSDSYKHDSRYSDKGKVDSSKDTYSFFDLEPWSSIKMKGVCCKFLGSCGFQNTDRVEAANINQETVADETNVLSIEEKGEAELETLPWSYTSSDIPETWLPPHHCNIECWHKDPVEVAASRCESTGRFKEASKLRMDFRGLSVLHRVILQWYRWAEEQWPSKDLPKKTLSGSSATLCKTESYAKETRDGSLRDTKYIEKSSDGKEFLSDFFDRRLGDTDVFAPWTNATKILGGLRRINGMRSIVSTNNPVIESCPVDLNLIKSTDFNQPQIFNPKGVISQQLKQKISHDYYPRDVQSHKNVRAEGSSADSNNSTAYRNHARWVLENSVMSDDSEDDSDDPTDSSPVLYPIYSTQPQGKSAKRLGRLPVQSVGRDYTESPWNDLFFIGDSDSSDCRNIGLSDSSESENFPNISGEELEKLLEDAKGTMQFHKWQNAAAGNHQKEFKTLIKLHRFAKDSEDRNQKRWRSRDQAEREKKSEVACGHNFPKNIYLPPGFEPSGESASKFPHTSFLNSKSESNLSTVVMPNKDISFTQKPLGNLKAKLQPVDKESEDYSYITADDIKFLRELKKQLKQVEDNQQIQASGDPSGTISYGNLNTKLQESQASNKPIPNITIRKLTGYVQSESNKIATMSPQEKSLRIFLGTAKPPLGISHRTEFENWFPRDQSGELAGPTPKRHYQTTPFGDVSFSLGSAECHPFFEVARSTVFKKLVVSVERFWNPKAGIFLSGFWVTENLFITALNFHPWAPSTTIKGLHDQIEDFKLRNDGIELFVSSTCVGPNDDPKAIKVVLRAWDTSARIAVFQPEDKSRVSLKFVGVDKLIEENAAYSYDGAYIATVGYNSLDAAKCSPVDLRQLKSGNRSVTFGEITVSEGYRENKVYSPPVFARLESGFSHGSYGRMCIILEANQEGSGSIIGIATGQYEERGSRRPEALSDFISTFPDGFKDELRRISKL